MSVRCIPILVFGLLAIPACSPLDQVDRRADRSILKQNALLADGTRPAPRIDPSDMTSGNPFPEDTEEMNNPGTVDPPAEDLPFSPRDVASNESQAVIDRIKDLAQAPADAEPLTLDDALTFAQVYAVEYTGAEEQYLLTALSLIIQEPLFEPSFFNTTRLDIAAIGQGRYDTSMRVTNDFGVTQRLPYGGEVTARFLANLTTELDSATSDNTIEDASFIVEGRLPLLRGAGLSARESLIQGQRNLVYAARAFEVFRRDFYVAIVTDYLDLVLRLQAIANAERGVTLNREIEERETALVAAGRVQAFQADLARSRTLVALDDLAAQQEAYRLALDRFKVRIGMDTEKPILILPTEVQLPVPDISQNTGVVYAMDYRLDLQTARDQLADSKRQIDIADNNMLPDLNLNASARIGDSVGGSSPFLDVETTNFSTGVFFSAPLDRVDESVRLRQAQLRFAQAERVYRQTLDTAALQVRQRIRQIDQAQFSLLLAERGVEIARNRIAGIDAAPERANARDRTDAVESLRDSEDQRDRAKRDLQVSILQYLRSAGLLRVTPNGRLQPLPNMPVGEVTGKPSDLEG